MALLVVLCAAALAGMFVFLGSDPGPVGEKDRYLVGAWTGDGVALELASVGRYALVLGSAGAPVECGKWRMVDGSLQMRAKKPASTGATLRMRQPGFRAGRVEHRTEPEALTLTLLSAQPANEAVRWKLKRASDTLLQRCD